MKPANEAVLARTRKRKRTDLLFRVFCIACASSAVLILGVLLTAIVIQGSEYMSSGVFTNFVSRIPENAGFRAAIYGSIMVLCVTAVSALPLGVATAIFLEEYRPKGPFSKRAHGFIELNIRNLAGVPSIVYGIIGLTMFARMFNEQSNASDPFFAVGVSYVFQYQDAAGDYVDVTGEKDDPPVFTAGQAFTDFNGTEVRVLEFAAFDELQTEIRRAKGDITWAETDEEKAAAQAAYAEKLDTGRGVIPAYTAEDAGLPQPIRKPWYLQAPFGRSVLAGGLTLMLVILPIVIIASQEALRAIPGSLREGVLAQGATRWQMVWKMTLPNAVPGIMTGSILALSRAIGEAAPVLVVCGVVFIMFTPQNLMDDFTVLPLMIFEFASRPQEEFHKVAASGIIVLLSVLLLFNATAVFIRQKFQKPLQ